MEHNAPVVVEICVEHLAGVRERVRRLVDGFTGLTGFSGFTGFTGVGMERCYGRPDGRAPPHPECERAPIVNERFPAKFLSRS